MGVSVSVWGMVGIIVIAMIIGYIIGRREQRTVWQVMQEQMTGKVNAGVVDMSDTGEGVSEIKPAEKRHRSHGGNIPHGRAIASPVEGDVRFFREGERCGAMIMPGQGMIYAPISGKIIKLYPMGNAFVLQADVGISLLIQVGRQRPDELCSMCFRSRIVQNEIVNKGKLLLEFDMEGLQAEGEDVTVTVSPENSMTVGEVTVTQKEHVKVGEELMWVSEHL